MEPKIKLKTKLSWHQIMSLGLTPDQIRHTYRCWFDSCRKYREMDIHFYADHAVVSLTKRKSRQIVQPEFIPYSKIWLARASQSWPPKEDDPFLMLVDHPTAGQIVTLVRDRNIEPRSMCRLVRAIDAGRKAEAALAYQRGF